MAEEASNNLEATEEINLTEDTANCKQETSTSEEVHSTSGSTENKNTMKALFLTSNVDCWCGDAAQIAKSFEIRETAVPVPKSGQVLIRVERSPINPSDLSSLKGSYGSTKGKALPYIPGFEGSGVVVANGGGLMGWSLLNKRVAVAATGGGMWAEYVVAPAMNCLILPDDVSYDVGASSFVNPLTALAFVEIVAAKKQRAFLHTAAASALGRMALRLAHQNGIEVVCVVRREEQKDLLNSLGANVVLVSTSPDFEKDLCEACVKYDCRIAFDAVGGPLVGKILHQMPSGTEYNIYGGLANEPVAGIPIGDFIFSRKVLQGFWLTNYIKSKNIIGLYRWQSKVKQLLNTILRTDVRASFPLDKVGEAIDSYVKNMSAGKALLGPFLSQAVTSSDKPSGAGESKSLSSDNKLFHS